MKTHQSLLENLGYICLYTSNLSESVAFYRDVLGLEPTASSLDVSSVDFYSFRTGTTTLALERNGVRKETMKSKAENPFLLQFKVNTKEQLELLNLLLEENGIKLFNRSKSTDYGIITSFCDPDGNKLEILFQA